MLYNQAQVIYLLIVDKDLNAMLPSQVQHSEWYVHLKSDKLRMIVYSYHYKMRLIYLPVGA